MTLLIVARLGIRLKPKRREENMVGPGRPEFVLFGSSIVQLSLHDGGWGSILSELYDRKADIFVRGYIAWNSRIALEVLHKIFPQDAAVQPALVIVYFGGNDSMSRHPSGLGSHVPLSEYVQNMKKIALHLKSLSANIRLIFLTSPPVDEAAVLRFYGNTFDKQERTNEACDVYAEALVKMCEELDGVKAINLWKSFQHRDDWGSAYLIDGIHLSSQGSKIMVKEILKVLKEADYNPSLYWLSMPNEFSAASKGESETTTIDLSNTFAPWKLEWMDKDELGILN